MKNKPKLLGIFLLQAITLNLAAQTFQWKRSLKPELSSGWHTFSMPVEVVAKTKPGFADLRIFTIGQKGDTTEVPYVLDDPSNHKSIEQKSFSILNKAAKEGRFYYTLEQTEGMATLNEIQLSFADENFDLRVTLEGSMDQQEWFTLLKDYRVTGIHNSKADFSFTTLTTDFSNYKYYRLNYATARDPRLTAAQYGISLKMNEGAWWEMKGNILKNDHQKKEQQTTCVIELPEPFPVSLLQFFIKDSFDYIRPVSISIIPWPDNLTGSDEDKFIPVSNGTLNSFDKQQIGLNEQLTQKLKIVISNNDNAPLTIDSILVKSRKMLVITRVPEAPQYVMMYGNKALSTPQYDLDEVLEKIEMPDFGNITVGEEQRNVPEAPKSWWEHNYWLYVLMGLVIVMLGWFTLKMMRNKTEEITN